MDSVELKPVASVVERQTTRAFSLIELIGILAVMSILLSIITPLLIENIDRVASETEEERLEQFAEGFVDYVTAFRALPGTNDWAAAIGGRLERRVEDVLVNGRGNDRQFLIDPSFWDGTTPNFPLSQNVLGWSQPDSPRFMILSSLGKPLPSGPFDFEELWLTPSGGIISTNSPWSTWDGSWEDLIIQRIHLGGQFHRLVLDNYTGESEAGFMLDGVGEWGGGALSIPGNTLDTYVLDGTQISLYNDGELAATEILTGDRSYYYNYGAWRNVILDGVGSSSGWVDDICDDLSNWIDVHGYDAEVITLAMNDEIFDVQADLCAVLIGDSADSGGDDGDSDDGDSDDGDSDDGDSDDGDSDDGDSDDGDSDDGDSDDGDSDDADSDDGDSDDGDSDDGDSDDGDSDDGDSDDGDSDDGDSDDGDSDDGDSDDGDSDDGDSDDGDSDDGDSDDGGSGGGGIDGGDGFDSGGPNKVNIGWWYGSNSPSAQTSAVEAYFPGEDLEFLIQYDSDGGTIDYLGDDFSSDDAAGIQIEPQSGTSLTVDWDFSGWDFSGLGVEVWAVVVKSGSNSNIYLVDSSSRVVFGDPDTVSGTSSWFGGVNEIDHISFVGKTGQ